MLYASVFGTFRYPVSDPLRWVFTGFFFVGSGLGGGFVISDVSVNWKNLFNASVLVMFDAIMSLVCFVGASVMFIVIIS